MSSILKIEANRKNGAKSKGPVSVDGKLKSLANSARSTGPVTPEGKASSSQNALRHGILAESVVLNSESREAFTEILAGLEDELHPDTIVERRYVETMALADWRRLRLLCLEKEYLAIEIRHQEGVATENLADSDTADASPNDASDTGAPDNGAPVEVNPLRNLALAFRALIDQSRVTELINRYEARYDRQYNRALHGLRAHRAEKRREASEKNASETK